MKPGSSIIRKTLQYGLLGALLATMGAFFWGPQAGAGVAAGAAIALGGLAFSVRFIPFAFSSRRPKTWFWSVWIIKLPLLGLLLYGLITRELVNPITFCLGIALVPLLLTLQGCLAAKREAA